MSKRSRIAALGITNEEVRHGNEKKVIVFLRGNRIETNSERETKESEREKAHRERALAKNGADPTEKVADPPVPHHIWKIPERDVIGAAHGAYLESVDAGIKMLFPSLDDCIAHERVNGHIVTIYKAQEFNDVKFSIGKETEYLALVHEIVSLARRRLIMPERKHVRRFIWNLFRDQRTVSKKKGKERELITIDTPCREFINADIRGVDFCVGKPIEERFGLESLNVMHGLSVHAFEGIAKDDPFYRRYPYRDVTSKEFTLRCFCEMIYDLVRIRHGYHC